MALAIVDTGCANLASVGFALQRLGVGYIVTRDAATIKSADHVILPGVGAMPYAMNVLKERGLIPILQSLTQPLMGICLGMQMLFAGSDEGQAGGLNLVPGFVKLLETGDLPAPHMGWNTLENISKDDPLMAGINSGDYVYYVHSYAAEMGANTLATCTYGQKFSAIVRQENIYGCQFHPERSGRVGAQIFTNFLKVKS